MTTYGSYSPTATCVPRLSEVIMAERKKVSFEESCLRLEEIIAKLEDEKLSLDVNGIYNAIVEASKVE